ncbi:MAG: radical SAM protein [Oscillospiraceae bacterium]|jgi:nitrogen fixation protein NifB|nr:radical SAM protein [Oscillospiraceae bacterium]
MSISLREVKTQHPCFATGAPNNKGRIHLPVSPGCNIACKFCERSINTTEQRPGVTANIITPSEAVDIVRRSVALSPDITVAGIAGPGDTLATPFALDTFRLIGAEFPTLLKCMSTNGLLLPENADALIDIGIDTLTVTVNAVDPAILAQLNGRITYHGRVYEGIEAAEILIRNQLDGIRAVTAAGMIVKVNTVLVPEINGGHIGEIARAVADAGASLYNIIPLIPQHELANRAVPTCDEIDGARTDAERHITVFRHCQHCRADAIGVPGGEDLGARVYGERRVDVGDTFSHG